MKNECLSAAQRELASVGIKPRVRDDRRHIFLEWDLPNGKRRQYTLPMTPSDWRSVLNMRAEIRRFIREDGLLEAARQKSTLAKALELPVPIAPESPDERMIRLEGEFAALSDIFFEEISALKERRPVIELRIDGVPMKIEPANAQIQVEAPSTQSNAPIKTACPRARRYVVDAIRPGESVGLTELARRTGRSVPNVSATLQYWKKKGVVENKDCKWRRVESGAERAMRADPAGPDLDG